MYAAAAAVTKGACVSGATTFAATIVSLISIRAQRVAASLGRVCEQLGFCDARKSRRRAENVTAIKC